jgi:hypothetical protein
MQLQRATGAESDAPPRDGGVTCPCGVTIPWTRPSGQTICQRCMMPVTVVEHKTPRA